MIGASKHDYDDLSDKVARFHPQERSARRGADSTASRMTSPHPGFKRSPAVSASVPYSCWTGARACLRSVNCLLLLLLLLAAVNTAGETNRERRRRALFCPTRTSPKPRRKAAEEIDPTSNPAAPYKSGDTPPPPPLLLLRCAPCLCGADVRLRRKREERGL